MVNFLIACAVGLLCGIVSGFGIGGGSVLMVWLTAVCSIAQKTAQGVNLLYFLPTAGAALILHTKNRQVEWKLVVPTALSGCAAAGLAANLATRIDAGLLQRFFGGFLILVGFSELFRKPKRAASDDS